MKDRRGTLALLALAALLLCFDAGARGLATNDEARFPMLARDMLRHGTWLVPRLGDTPYLNKPPLEAWLIALVSWPVGAVTQATAVWPSLLAGLGIVLTTWWIGARLWSGAVGLTAGFIVLTMHGVFTLARTPMPDIVLGLAITGAMAAFVAAEFLGRARALMLCWTLLALGFLAKGPAAFLGLGVLAVYALFAGEGSRLHRLGRLRGAVAIAPMIAPWWIVAFASRGTQFVQDSVAHDWLGWFQPFAHPGVRTVLTPLEQVVDITLPWAPLLLVALVVVRGRDTQPRGAVAFLLAWLGVVFVIVALSHQQRMRYYLPLCPPAALLIAVWYQGLRVRGRALAGWAVAAAVVVGLVVWQVRDDAGQNALTDLGGVATSGPPLYTLGVPNLVAAFYLDRPATSLDAPRRGGLAAGEYLVEDRALPAWPAGCAAERVGGGLANGRPFVALRVAPPGCAER
jgi:4-amino-4-deoxy-L-arabinose transferase-like glycosyltransferase